ncbi:MAG: XRE family transcriptional regulator [Pseudomonas sp.]|nr:XRE family transcriptional regulator [Pseudomonas sp.]
MNIKQMRIDALRALMGGLSQKEFADRHNLDASYLSQLLTGHRALGEKAAANLETKIGLAPGTLVSPKTDLGLEGTRESLEKSQDSPIKGNAEIIGPISVWDDTTPLDDDEVYVPFLKEIELSAGNGRTAVQQSLTHKLRFGRRTLRRQGVQPSEAVCVTVSGNSMEPVLPDGSTVGVDQGNTSIIDGKMFALNHSGQLRVKNIYRLPGGGIRLRSYNREEHPDEEYTLDQMKEKDIFIIGKVFWYSVLL